MKYLIERYNDPRNVIVISSYPEKNTKYSRKVCAVGGFSKNIIEQLNKQKKNHRRFIVLTTILHSKKEIYEEKNTLICRVLKRNNPLSYITLIYYLLRLRKVGKILIQFEFASFGDTFATSFFLPVLFFLHAMKKSPTIVLHQVVENLHELDGHLGWSQTSVKAKIVTFLLQLFYKGIALACQKIVVLEQEFVDRLIRIGVPSEQIELIPHGVDSTLKIVSKPKARKLLGLPRNKHIVLYFGYLTWYKGADIFLKIAAQTKNPHCFFLLAGGPSFTQKNKAHYQHFLQQFQSIPKNMKITGFVEEHLISLYFSAADVVLLPYRSMISSSGPLSLAFSHEKPVIMSNRLLPYLKSSDFLSNLATAQVLEANLFFHLERMQITKGLKKLNTKRLIQFSRLMKKSRSYVQIARRYNDVIKNGAKPAKTYAYKLAIKTS